MGKITFITGGSRSGKSIYAERIAKKSGDEIVYVASCRTTDLDTEMAQRIERHKKQRPAHWDTVENEFDLQRLCQVYKGKTLLLDCLTLWLANEMGEKTTDELLLHLDETLETIVKSETNWIIVSNELGMGVVPLGKETREYRDLVGWANQKVASFATDVTWTISGIPVPLKRENKKCALPTEEM